MIHLLAFFLTVAVQDDSQIRASLSELRQRLGQMEQDFQRQRSLLEQQLSRPTTTCTAEIRLFNKPESRLQTASRTLAPDAAIMVGASTAVSSPTDHCLSGQLVVRATYFDTSNNFLCSGSVIAAAQTEHTQVTLLEIHPWRTREFVLWKNGAPGSLPSELQCRDVNGGIILEPWQARTLRLQITALPRNGGVASVEFDVMLEVPER